jgi:hypothetical protein
VCKVDLENWRRIFGMMKSADSPIVVQIVILTDASGDLMARLCPRGGFNLGFWEGCLYPTVS